MVLYTVFFGLLFCTTVSCLFPPPPRIWCWKVATGSLDGGRGFAKNMASIVADDGWKGLYGKNIKERKISPNGGLFIVVNTRGGVIFSSVLVFPVLATDSSYPPV